MAFTFDPALSNDISLVRFHIGDTNEEGHYLEDETIEALLLVSGNVGGAVISCLRYIITQLSSPDFKKDWLSVDNSSARESYEKILREKEIEFGISVPSFSAKSTISLPERSDV